jgi:hypothetical protein
MTKIVSIRLTEKEFLMLDGILSSENCESENRSEWFRLLLYREWNKRRKLGVPSPVQYQSSFRVNRRTTSPFRTVTDIGVVLAIESRKHRSPYLRFRKSRCLISRSVKPRAVRVLQSKRVSKSPNTNTK